MDKAIGIFSLDNKLLFLIIESEKDLSNFLQMNLQENEESV